MVAWDPSTNNTSVMFVPFQQEVQQQQVQQPIQEPADGEAGAACASADVTGTQEAGAGAGAGAVTDVETVPLNISSIGAAADYNSASAAGPGL